MSLVSAASLSVYGFQNTPNSLSFNPLSTTTSFLKVGADNGLISYKVYFRRIELCEELTVNGTGYSGSNGCATLYSNESDAYTGTQDPTAADLERFTAAGTGKYYDLLSSTDLAALKAAMSTSIDARTYNWGLMETHPWVKIKAKSGTFCTKSGGTFVANGQFASYVSVASLDCGSGGAEEAVVYMVNGNSSFKFNTPLEVKEDASVRADIIFNLDDNVKYVTTTGGDQTSVGIVAADFSKGFSVPMFVASPAVLDSSAKIVKESYEFILSSVTGGTITSGVFYVDLYYSSKDTNKTPFAVTGGLTQTDGSQAIGRSEKFDEIIFEGTTIKLADWEGKFPITFTRTEAGASSTGSLSCGSSTGYLGSCPGGAMGAATATLTDSNGPTVAELP